MGAPIGGLDHRRYRVALLGVDHRVGTQAFGMLKFAVIDVHCANVQAQSLGVLHPQVPKPANAGDHNPLARLGLCFFDAFVGGDACTNKRRCIDR